MKITMLLQGHHGRLATAALAFLVCNGAAWADTYNPVTGRLTVPVVTVGAATYVNTVVTIAGVVSGPTGTTANGSQDAYDTASGQLTIPTVTVGSAAYHNVVATVGKLISIGGTIEADTYYTSLAIPYVQVGEAVYNNVVTSVGQVLSVGGGMPNNARDVYDPVTHELSIAAVLDAGNVYTNVVITVGTVQSVGGLSPQQTLLPDALYFSCYAYCQPKVVLLINTGATALSLSNITVNSPLAGYGHPVFAEVNNCHAGLGPGQSCAITMRFGSPNFDIRYTGSLNIADDGAGSPQVTTLSGIQFY